MKKNKKKSFFQSSVNLVLLVIIGLSGGALLSHYGNYSHLFTSVIGDPSSIQYKGYAYNSEPLNLNYGATNFTCNPGPIQTSGSYAGTYNTYYYGYSKVYTNSGVPGSWCQNYSSNLDQTVYTASNPPPNNHEIDPFQIRWWDHINAAKKHEAIPVIYEKKYITNYPTFYQTGGYESINGGAPNQYSGFYPVAVVKCPAGAQAVDHTKYGATLSSYHLINQNNQEGEFDGSGHKWCELNGVAVAPIIGLPDGTTMLPEIGSQYLSKLYRFEFPNGIVKYKYFKKHDPLKDANGNNVPVDAWVKCENGVEGPYIYGQNQYYSQYATPTEEEKRPFYRCLRADRANFVEPIVDNEPVPTQYNTIGNGYFRISTLACPAGDATCGGANTLGNIMNGCATGTYWCQSKNQYFRYCSSTPDCAGKTDVPFFSYIVKPLSSIVTPISIGKTTNLNYEIYQKIDNQLLQNISDIVTYQLLKNNTQISFCALSTTSQALSGVYDLNQPEGARRGIITMTCNPTAENVGEHDIILKGISPYNQQAGGAAEFNLAIKLTINFKNVGESCTSGNECATEKCILNQCSNGLYNESTCNANFECLSSICYNNKCVQKIPTLTTQTTSCGDGFCNGTETSQNCVKDCPLPVITTNNNGQTAVSTGTTGINQNSETFIQPNETTVLPQNTTNTITTPESSNTNQECLTGKICTSGWCNGGEKQCFYPNSSFTCVSMQKACIQGTTRCSPSDKNCIEPGSYGTLDGWCVDGMSCYTSDSKKKYCHPMEYKDPSTYMTTATMMTPQSCPEEFKTCSPNDKNCLEIGETGKTDGSSYWCSGDAKQCFMGDGALYCSAANKECPSGASACRKEDTKCIEPGKYGPNDGWCGGRNTFSCYKNDGSQTFCAQIADMNPLAWEQAICPERTSRCRSTDKYCLELGKTGPSGSWCSSGIRKDNADGTITCIKSSDLKNTDIASEQKTTKEKEVCKNIITPAFNPLTKECKNFATSCISNKWETISSDKICQDGKILNVGDLKNQDALRAVILGDNQFLKTSFSQLKNLPIDLPEVITIKNLINESLTILSDISNTLDKPKNEQSTIQEKLDVLHKKQLSDIKIKLEEIAPYIEFNIIKNELKSKIATYKVELNQIKENSIYNNSLREKIDTLESLLGAGEKLRGHPLAQILVAIKNTRNELENLTNSERQNQSQDFMTEVIVIIKNDLAKFNNLIEEKKIDDYQIIKFRDKLEYLLKNIEISEEKGISAKTATLIDDVTTISNKLKNWLSAYGLEKNEDVKVQQFLENQIEKEMAMKIDAMFSSFSNKIEIMMNEQMKQIAVKLAEVTKKFNKISNEFEKTIAQSLNNLTYISETYKTEIIKSKTNLIQQVEDIENAISNSNVGAFTAEKIRETTQLAAKINWCGELAEKAQTTINTTGISLENKEITPEEVTKFKENIKNMAEKNKEECYKIGASNFRDIGMEEWHFGPAQYNYQKNFIKGYYDSQGHALGQFGAGNPTLRIEALTMFVRIFNMPLGEKETLIEDINSVPEWGIPYINAAINAKVNFDKTLPMDKPISRLETAEMIVAFLQATGEENFKMPTEITKANKYPDYAKFSDAKDASLAVDMLTDLGIFKGADDGNFYPDNNLLRSEFGALNQRINETFGVEK